MSGNKIKIFLQILFLTSEFLLTSCTSVIMQKVAQPRPGIPVDGKIAVVYSSRYGIYLYGLEKLHPFDIKKYEEIYTELVRNKELAPENIFVPGPLADKDILLVQTQDFLNSLNDSDTIAEYLEAPQTAYLPVSVLKSRIIQPFRTASGGTLLAAEKALEFGTGINIGGGYHHAKPFCGEGFCIFADIPIAIRKLQKEGKIRRALVIDLDVHQGNGTALCLDKDDQVFTFSMHEGDIYPVPKEHSDLDIEMNAGDGDREVLEKLEFVFPKIFEQAAPDIVFYVAGCDMLAGDPLADMQMTETGIKKRDAMVIQECWKRNIPVVMTLGGGYSKNAWHVQYESIKNILHLTND